MSRNLSYDHNVERMVSSVVKVIAIGDGGLAFKSPGRSNWTQRRQRLATAATFFLSCAAQALSREDGLRHSLHASAEIPRV